MTASVLTRRDCERQLPDGSDQLAIEIHLAATAADRAESRKQAVIAAARGWLGAHADEEGLLPALLSCEVGGTGGPGGFCREPGTESTARMSWASGLGKGRRHASDGEAWTAAMRHAGGRPEPGCCEPDHVLTIARLCSESDIEWPLAYAMRAAATFRMSPDNAAAPWSACAREIAALCEPSCAAGKLAVRYGMATRARRYSASVTVMWRDYDDSSHLPTEGGAQSICEESVEDFSGKQLDIGPEWRAGEWRVEDDTDTVIRVTRDPLLRQYQIDLSSRSLIHPAALRVVRRLWMMRWIGDTSFADQVIAAHAELSGMHPDILGQHRDRWDIEADGGLAVGSTVSVGGRKGAVREVDELNHDDRRYRVRIDSPYSLEWWPENELTLIPDFDARS